MSDLAPPTPKRKQNRASPEALALRAKLHDTRVEQVADMMRGLQFRSQITPKSLVEAWGVPVHVVRKIVSEAAKITRKEYDEDRVGSKLAIALDHVIDSAIESGDRRSVIDAARVWHLVTGGTTAKVQMQVSPDLSAMSLEQLRARRDEVLRKLQENQVIELPALTEGDE